MRAKLIALTGKAVAPFRVSQDRAIGDFDRPYEQDRTQRQLNGRWSEWSGLTVSNCICPKLLESHHAGLVRTNNC